jgi:Zn-dependent peptidase ImmA (M78 family)/transcriptional regulator with XRE-family HTH domain
VVGERVKLAREASRLTQQDLADAIGAPLSAIADVEVGRVRTPSEDLVRHIAVATSFPVGFFERGPLPYMPDGHYRKLKRGTARVSKQIRAQVRQVLELVQNAEETVPLPPVQISAVRGSLTSTGIEEAAAQVRRQLGFNDREPIANLVRATERAGVVVVRLPTVFQDHDGFSVWPDVALGGRPVIALGSTDAGDRARHTLGHELGHLVLHTLRFDLSSDEAEAEAHRFAGALLIPRKAAVEAMRSPLTVGVLMSVKAHYGVSLSMASRRALDLGLIDRPHFVSLQKQLSKRGWRSKEPVRVEVEAPILITRIIDGLAGQGAIADRAERLGLPLFAFNGFLTSSGPREARVN